ncbi:uncharacterized protein LOC144912248 [Branchiostoma floridae x Branchiostoma belcheri]
MPVTYLMKKPICLQKTRLKKTRQIKRRNLPDRHVRNNVKSQGDYNTIINSGNNSTVVPIVVNIRNLHVHVERPLQPTARPHTKKQKLCRKLLDRLDQLSARGALKKCKESINRLLRCTRDSDCRATLWIAAAACFINGGKMKNAGKALCHVTGLLDQTENSSEHKLARDYYQSLIDLREDRYDHGVRVIMMALYDIQMKQVGHVRALIMINLGWLYTKMAQLEQDHHKQAELIKDAKESFGRAIDDSGQEDEEEEFPGQLQDKKTRICQCAWIGGVYLRLRCWCSALPDGNNTNQGTTDEIPEEDITEAQQILFSLEDREPLCGICEVLYHLAQAHMCYRGQKYPEALKEAKEARDLAICGDFKNYIDIAESIVKLFKQAVL